MARKVKPVSEWTNEGWFAFSRRCDEEYGRYYCRRCADRDVMRGACEHYSMGAYAGMLCERCWSDDGRNHDRPFDPMDAGEHFGEEDY